MWWRAGLLFLVLVACSETEPDKPAEEMQQHVVARCNDQVLTLEQIQTVFTPEQWENLSRDEKLRFVEGEWKPLMLLVQEATSRGISERPDVRFAVRNARNKIVANYLIEEITASVSEPTEQEMVDYFDTHKDEFKPTTQTELKIQRILVDSQEKLQEVLGLLTQGAGFKTTAQSHSTAPDGKSGGYRGFMSREELGQSLYDMLLEAGRYNYIDHPVNGGFEIIRYYDTRTASRTSFLEVRDVIFKRMLEEKKKSRYEELMRELEQKTTFEIVDL